MLYSRTSEDATVVSCYLWLYLYALACAAVPKASHSSKTGPPTGGIAARQFMLRPRPFLLPFNGSVARTTLCVLVCARACVWPFPERFTLQRLVAGRVRACVLRCVWRRDKAPYMWSCTNHVRCVRQCAARLSVTFTTCCACVLLLRVLERGPVFVLQYDSTATLEDVFQMWDYSTVCIQYRYIDMTVRIGYPLIFYR